MDIKLKNKKGGGEGELEENTTCERDFALQPTSRCPLTRPSVSVRIYSVPIAASIILSSRISCVCSYYASRSLVKRGRREKEGGRYALMKERIYNGLLVMSLLLTIRNDRLLSAPRIRMPRDKSDIGEMAKWFSNGFARELEGPIKYRGIFAECRGNRSCGCKRKSDNYAVS